MVQGQMHKIVEKAKEKENRKSNEEKTHKPLINYEEAIKTAT